MYKVRVITTINYSRFNDIKNLKRIGPDIKGVICAGDIFEVATEEEYIYLKGKNSAGLVVVDLIEFIPDKVIPKKVEVTPKKNKKKK